jgi:urease accessory protein
MRIFSLIAIAGLVALGLVAPAFAHVGEGAHTHGFVYGVLHPLSGADHLLALLAVGAWSALAMPARFWLAPFAFMSAMLVGAGAAAAGLAVPAVELGVVISVIVLGLMIAARFDAGAAIGGALIAAFAIFHGNAHGLEATGAMASYMVGFSLATGALHALGLGLGLLMTRSRVAAPAAGSLIAGAGLWLLVA